MKLGISSYSYTWAVGVPGHYPTVRLSETDLLSRAKELGVNLVQVADNMPLHLMPENRLNQLVDDAGNLNIELEAGANRMTSENLERYIEIAHRIKSRILRFVIDGDDFRPELEEIISIIKNAEPELRKREIVLAIENHDRLYTYQFEEIITRVGSPFVAICLDCANSLGVGEGIREVVSRLAPYSVNFHLKEVSIKRKFHKMGFDIEGKPFGEGTLPLHWMLKQLPEKCRTAILEQWTPPEPDIRDTLRKEERWARQSIKYLRNYIKD
jgi:sugar phosphate isomerase/epimerase